jgi:sugar phosphate isomerase/epimerase
MTMQLSRRHFLAGAAALSVTGHGGAAFAGLGGKPFKKIGVQLYTVRDALNADPGGTLSRVRGIGFDEVETAGFAGKSAKEFRALLDGAGLTCISGHVGYDDWFKRPEAALDDMAALGAKYAVLAWLQPDQRKEWVALGQKMNQWGELCKARGLQMTYHNHDFEFQNTPEGMPFHLLLEHTDPKLVAFELDCYWASFAGHDPVHVLHEHGDRIRLLHVKDKGADGKMTPVGQGTIDWSKVLPAGKQAGVTNIFVEHDNPADPFASITAGLKYLKG